MQKDKLNNQEKTVVSYLIHSVAGLAVDKYGITDDHPYIFLTDPMRDDLRSAFSKIREFKPAFKPAELSFDETIKETILLILAQFLYAERNSIGKITDIKPFYLGETTKKNLWKATDLLEIEVAQLI